MITTVEMSKIYGLTLLDLYGATKYNCIVVGITDIDNVANNESDYNIYETYFKPVGLGLTSYYTAIKKSTPIYICKPVESLEPLTFSDEKIFIPSSLINFDNSVEYKECTNFNFNIYPIIRRFTSETERNKYIEEIKKTLKEHLKRLIDFSILDSDIDVSYSPIYLPEEDITEIEEKRNIEFAEYNKRINEKISNDAKRIKNYDLAINSAKNKEVEYESLNRDLKVRIAELDSMIRLYRETIGNS